MASTKDNNAMMYMIMAMSEDYFGIIVNCVSAFATAFISLILNGGGKERGIAAFGFLSF